MADSTLVLAQLTIDDLPPGVPASGVSIELRAAAGGDEGAEPSPPLATAALEVANHTATMIGALSTPLPAAAPPAAEGEEAPGPFDSLAVVVKVEGVDGVLCSAALAALGVVAGRAEGNVTGAALEKGDAVLPSAEGDAGAAAAAAKAPPAKDAKKGAPAAAADDAAAPSGPRLSCSWRLERTLPSLVEQRSRPLAVRCFAPAAREEVNMRHTRWREEMHHEHGTDNPRQGASWRWERAPPQKPSYLKGDLVSRAARNEYVTGMNAQRMLLSAQAVQRDLAALVATLHAAVKAEQATRALHQIMKFLQVRNSAQFCANSAQFSDTSSLRVQTGANLTQIEADETLAMLNRLFLPFERLVRNVWVDGPEKGYDLAKVALREMLQARPPARPPAAAADADADALPSPLPF